MIIKQLKSSEDKSEICNTILRSLPQWFGIESAIVDYVNDVKEMDTWVAIVNNETIGFISINKHNPFTAEIHVMGVLENYHRKNIGSELIECAETYLIKSGFKFLQVKTLSESREDANYAKTRNFYLKSGFVPVEEFKTLWGEHNPCLLMIKNLENTKSNTLLSHLEINVSDYARSIRFYDTILIPLGWKRLVCQDACTTFSDGTLKLVISPTEKKFIDNGFHRKKIGINHLAFYAPSKKFVDNFQHEVLSKNNIQCLYENKPSGDDTYYALFFEDPDRIKIEIVFSPDYCSPTHWTNKLDNNFDPYSDSELMKESKLQYKGTLIEESLIDPKFVNNILIKKVEISTPSLWHIYSVEIFEKQITEFQKWLKDGPWYMHFWNADYLIVVFKNKLFKFSKADKTSWAPSISYGIKIGIPQEQLDFLMEFDR